MRDQSDLAIKPRFSVGDLVDYTNDYGVNWGVKTVERIEKDKWGWQYYVTPTDTPWMYVREKNLALPQGAGNAEFGSW